MGFGTTVRCGCLEKVEKGTEGQERVEMRLMQVSETVADISVEDVGNDGNEKLLIRE
jgi:hypothetical protein